MVSTIGVSVAAGVLYVVSLIIYRLFFHPLARFPGPKIPACTLWYEFYYDVVLRGQFIWQVQKWHEQYGPIIRVSPHELHVHDPYYLDEIYGSQTRKRDKYDKWVVLSGTPGASFATVSHDLHRLRRNALNPFFSKRAVTDLESLIQSKINILANRFERACTTGEVIKVDCAYIALTMDVMCQYTFADDDNYLMEDDFREVWKECLTTATEVGALLRQFPWVGDFMKKLPDSIVAKLNPPMAMLIEWRHTVEKRARLILASSEKVPEQSRRTIFHELRDGDLPAHEKHLDRLVDEVQILFGAGSETSSQTLAYTTFYLLSNPDKLERMREDLKSVLPTVKDTVSHTVIEQLPYVNAVVSEGLRLSFGVVSRLPRVAPDETLQYKEWTIPQGTPISSTSYFTLMDPRIFPEPEKFLPERWLSTGKSSVARGELHRYLVNFGKGTRQCVGINLAYAEIYLTIATIFRRFKLELYETTIEDVQCKHDLFTAVPSFDSKGIRIKVIGQYDD